jgi:hypothetical protein
VRSRPHEHQTPHALRRSSELSSEASGEEEARAPTASAGADREAGLAVLPDAGVQEEPQLPMDEEAYDQHEQGDESLSSGSSTPSWSNSCSSAERADREAHFFDT